MIIILPFIPPSLNASYEVHRFGTKASIGKSKAFYDFRDSASWIVQSHRRGECMEGPVAVDVRVRRPRANADLDNYAFKAICDALQKGGALVNDSQVARLVAEWAGPDVNGCVVTVTRYVPE